MFDFYFEKRKRGENPLSFLILIILSEDVLLRDLP